MYDFRIEQILSKAFNRPLVTFEQWQMQRSAFARSVEARQQNPAMPGGAMLPIDSQYPNNDF